MALRSSDGLVRGAFEGVLPPHPQPVSPDGGKGRILCFCCEKNALESLDRGAGGWRRGTACHPQGLVYTIEGDSGVFRSHTVMAGGC